MRGSRRGPAKRFEDILANIILIEEFTAGMDLAAFAQDPKTSNASERCLERISEAAKNRFARRLNGLNCGPLGTSFAMNTTGLKSVAFG